ncbi:MAG: hypothetical protein E6H60_01800 [Betaproteobacteria bacterium]|nr:MAG: hypothetical protein E6H60_01800 [Betaproteobacteria bacterium]
MRWVSAAILALASIVPAAALTPVVDFDLNRYYGTWYEIAAIRGFLQSRCARDTRAEYTAAEYGAIATRSHCLRADGTAEINEARARPLDPALPSVLKVTSVNFLGIWWYPFGRESIIIALGPEYRWLAAGHPSQMPRKLTDVTLSTDGSAGSRGRARASLISAVPSARRRHASATKFVDSGPGRYDDG